jgi:ribosomal protein S18 acetylase RimI-like enzyme
MTKAMSSGDVEHRANQLYAIHKSNFPNDLSTKLGVKYLAALFQLIIKGNKSYAFIFKSNQNIQGFSLFFELAAKNEFDKSIRKIKYSFLLKKSGVFINHYLARLKGNAVVENVVDIEESNVVLDKYKVLYLYLIEVDRTSEIKGVGTEMHNHAVCYFRAHYDYMMLSVATSNRNALEFYRNKGWQVYAYHNEAVKLIFNLKK